MQGDAVPHRIRSFLSARCWRLLFEYLKAPKAGGSHQHRSRV